MIYVQRVPAAPLDRFVRFLWYARAAQTAHRRERILPSGCAQLILSLARDFLLDCPEDGPEKRIAPALIVGQRSVYEMVDTSDMADLTGVVFAPGALPVFMADRAALFKNLNIALEDVWGGAAHTLRDRLREIASPNARLQYLEEFLTQRLAACASEAIESNGAECRRQTVRFALQQFARSPGLTAVRQVARTAGLSERRLLQIFREEVGFSPKEWCRIQRFQRAVKMLHSGTELPWSELALDCGFYDQSHFANEFRAFSGVNATTYLKQRSQWENHLRAE